MGDWKFLQLGSGKGTYLFNVTTDLHEGQNLLSKYPEKAQAMQQQLDRWLAQQEPADLTQGPSQQAIDYYNFFLDSDIH